jgi:hypothetical protein
MITQEQRDELRKLQARIDELNVIAREHPNDWGVISVVRECVSARELFDAIAASCAVDLLDALDAAEAGRDEARGKVVRLLNYQAEILDELARLRDGAR